MKRLFNMVTKKSTTALILFFFEIITSALVVLILDRSFLIFGVVAYFFNIIIIFFIANSKANPAYKISWIFAVILLPLVGGLLYLTFGKRRTVKKFKKNVVTAKYANFNFSEYKINKKFIESLNINKNCLQMINWVYNVSRQPVYSKTKTEFLPSGDSYFKNLIEDLKKAKKTIFIEFFIISPGKMWGDILNILIKKVKNNVDVRIIYDDFGAIVSLPKHYEKYLNKIGIKCKVFNPIKPRFQAFMNNRDHRKMVVIDGKIAYTGGVNFADEYINHKKRFGFWQDCGVKLEGLAVKSFVILFLDMWNYVTSKFEYYEKFIPKDAAVKDDGLIMPFGDNPVNSYYLNDAIYLKIVTTAKKYVYIQTPYLIIDDKLTNSLLFSAQSGVEVIIVTPNVYDKFYVHALTRSFYERLIKAGVKIYEFTPGFIHSKVIISDGIVGVLGTANFDFRSLYLHFECSVWMYKTKALKQIYEDFKIIISKSKRVNLKECKQRNVFEKLLGFLLKPFSSFL